MKCFNSIKKTRMYLIFYLNTFQNVLETKTIKIVFLELLIEVEAYYAWTTRCLRGSCYSHNSFVWLVERDILCRLTTSSW